MGNIRKKTALSGGENEVTARKEYSGYSKVLNTIKSKSKSPNNFWRHECFSELAAQFIRVVIMRPCFRVLSGPLTLAVFQGHRHHPSPKSVAVKQLLSVTVGPGRKSVDGAVHIHHCPPEKQVKG